MTEKHIERWVEQGRKLAEFCGVDISATGDENKNIHCTLGRWVPLIVINTETGISVSTYKLTGEGQTENDDQVFDSTNFNQIVDEMISKILNRLWSDRVIIKAFLNAHYH